MCIKYKKNHLMPIAFLTHVPAHMKKEKQNLYPNFFRGPPKIINNYKGLRERSLSAPSQFFKHFKQVNKTTLSNFNNVSISRLKRTNNDKVC